MNIRKHYAIVMTLLVIGLILSACAAPTPAPTAAPTQVPPTVAPTIAPTIAPTQVPPTEAPTQAPPTVEPTKAPVATKAPASAGEPGTLYSTETVPCPSSITKAVAAVGSDAEVEGQTYSCGVVVVPENYAKPDGRTIELFYLKLHSSSPSPAPDPMVYLAGGPGGSGSYEVTNPVTYLNLNEIRKHRDLIAYDQRGTGYSNYLLCAPFESAIGILQDRSKNPDIATTLKDLQDKDFGVGYDALRANLCGVVTRQLAGVDLGQYNSVVSAQDIAHLTEALGYTDGYNLYGTSYGTRLAQYAMRSTPEHIRSVVLDGVSGVAVPNVMWGGAKRFESYVALFQQCAADAACNAAYPDLATRFGVLLDKLEQKPLVFDPPLVVNPQLTFGFPPVLKQIDPDFFVQLAGLNNEVMNGGFARVIPRFILAAEQGDLDYFRHSGLSASGPAPEQVETVATTTGDDAAPLFHPSQPLFQAPFEMLLVLAQATAAQAQTGIDSQWLSIVLGDFAARLQAGENQADLMEALLRLSVVPNMGTTAKYLTDYATTYLSPSAAEAANAVVGQMTRNDVRATMWAIQDIAMMLGQKQDSRSVSDGMTHAFNCADEVAFTSLDVAQRYVDESPYPQLVVFPMVVNEESIAICLSYPTTLDKSVTEPVVSDIPTLIYLGQIDTQTPVTWGRSVAKGLSNSLVVEWNNMGHIIASHDQKLCAGEIAAAFLDDPAQKPDLTCAQSDAYKLKFILPTKAEPTKTPEPAALQNIPRLRELDFAPFDAALAAFTADRAAQIDAIVKDADIAQVQDAVKAGKLTYAELTLYFLSRIKQYDEALRTMVELNPDALKEAQAADQKLKEGKATGALFGMPVTLKDNIETAAPMHTTGGSQILLNNQPKADASFVKQLRDAGAVILGKANLSEFAGGIAMLPPGASAVGGLVINPHGDFSAGGSSSGSAAGSAAYETMVSVGSETAGSLIIPSSWNGVVGMYPGKGVVDGRGVIPLIKNNDSAGPIGRNVKDVAALLDVIDTKDTDYVAGLDAKALNGAKAAFLKADILAQAPNILEDSADNAAVAQLIVKSLTNAGAKVSDIELAPAQIGAQLNGGLSVLIAGGVRHDMLPYLTAAGAPVKTPEDLAAYNLKDPQTRIPFKQGTLDNAIANADVKDAAAYQEGVTQVKAAAVAALDQAFADSGADVLVSVNNYHSQVYATANYPAISVPLGLRKNGMPVGVVLIGKPGSEAKLLAYAYALEQATKLRVDPDLSK